MKIETILPASIEGEGALTGVRVIDLSRVLSGLGQFVDIALFDTALSILHPHTAHRQMLIERDGYAGIASPVKLSRTPASYRMPPPTFGQHQLELELPIVPDV